MRATFSLSQITMTRANKSHTTGVSLRRRDRCMPTLPLGRNSQAAAANVYTCADSSLLFGRQPPFCFSSLVIFRPVASLFFVSTTSLGGLCCFAPELFTPVAAVRLKPPCAWAPQPSLSNDESQLLHAISLLFFLLCFYYCCLSSFFQNVPYVLCFFLCSTSPFFLSCPSSSLRHSASTFILLSLSSTSALPSNFVIKSGFRPRHLFHRRHSPPSLLLQP